MLHAGLETLTTWARALGVFQFRPPDAGAICFLRYDLPVSSLELAERLREEQDVLVVPGAHFGMEPYIRIGYGLLPNDLAAALERTGTLVRELAGARSGN
jgi:aspartate/methionine/tyrosine aminotransferase